MRILLIEDERELIKALTTYLQSEGYIVISAPTIKQADYEIKTAEYDCILLDLMLPDGNGLTMIPVIQKEQANCGIIVITAKNSLADKVTGLDEGADDYISKPFHLNELSSRIKSVLRRRNYGGKNEIVFNEIKIDTRKHTVTVADLELEITKKEYDILLFFIANINRTITKEQIVEHIWSDDSSCFDNFDFIYTHIRNLRRKITALGGNDYIESVYGIGYKMSVK